MPDTEYFVVDKSSKKIKKGISNSYTYWRGDLKGTIDMEISVFTSWNHEKEAKLIYDALVKAGLQERYFSLRIEVK